MSQLLSRVSTFLFLMSVSSPSVTAIEPASVLGKRKASSKVDTYVLHLASSPEPTCHTDSDFELGEKASSSNHQVARPILVNGKLVEYTKKQFKCTYVGCDKSYTKPSRLQEHQRSHTGQVSPVCSTGGPMFH